MRTLSIVVALLLAGAVPCVAGCETSGGPDDPDDPVVIEGRWVGELESGFTPMGQTTLVLDVTSGAPGEPIVATIVFGEGEPPAAPTDPDVGWPAHIDPLRDGELPVAEGLTYAITSGTRTGDRVRFEIPVTELWAPWCEIQTPYQTLPGSDEAQCLPNREWTATPFDCHFNADARDPETPVECLKLTLCRRANVCDCTIADGGSCVPSSDGLTMYLEAMFRTDTATGTVAWGGDGMAAGTTRVTLTRE